MSNIQFGWTIPGWPQDNSSASQFVEQLVHNLDQINPGFDSAWVSDHFLPPPDQPGLPTLESWTTLCYLAHAFPARLRWPSRIAIRQCWPKLLSGGRFILGIGAAWGKEEYRSYGYGFPWPSPGSTYPN
jgi:alkanesulfonate monooxygenase SsuD/methylene tetrahydromethanopterin reductase-like flavin-dependent oxidoreductase (luciferase family)